MDYWSLRRPEERTISLMRNERAFSPIIAVAILGIVLMVGIPSLWWLHIRRSNLEYCELNLHKLHSALDAYATDNGGRYPQSLEKIYPRYLASKPQCRTAESYSYGDGYSVSAKGDAFTVCCKGVSHMNSGLERDFPRTFGSR